MAVRVRLLGGLGLEAGDLAIDRFPTRKVALLLAVLAHDHPRPVSRDALMAILWPDSEEEFARQNLRQALAMLRRTLGPQRDLIQSDRDHVSLQGEVETDLCDPYDTFLPGFYEDWVIESRTKLERAFVVGAIEKTFLLLAQKRNSEAIRLARRAVEIDELSEASHVALIRALVADSRAREAEAQAATMRRLLIEELGVEPSEETAALVRNLLSESSPQNQKLDRLLHHLRGPDSPERAAACAELLERAYRSWYGVQETEWIRRISEVEREIEAVLRWTTENEPGTAVRIAGPMGRYWLSSRDFARGKVILERALANAPPDSPIARAKTALFVLTLMSGGADPSDMASLLDDAETRYRQANDAWGLAHVQRNRGLLANFLHQTEDAKSLYDQAYEGFEAIGDKPGMALCLMCKGIVRASGRPELGVEACEQAYLMFREIGNDWGRRTTVEHLAKIRQHLSPDQLVRLVGYLDAEAHRHTARTDRLRLIELHSIAASIYHLLSDLPSLLLSMARLAQHMGDYERQRMLGACQVVRALIPDEHTPADDELAWLIALDPDLEPGFAAQRAAGASLSLTEIVQFIENLRAPC